MTKNNAHLITHSLTNIINTVLRRGQFPILWKKTEIVPLNKVKTPHTFKQLRPISLLFHLGKVSKTVSANLIKHQQPDLENQYVYTKQRGTTDALGKFSTDIGYRLKWKSQDTSQQWTESLTMDARRDDYTKCAFCDTGDSWRMLCTTSVHAVAEAYSTGALGQALCK